MSDELCAAVTGLGDGGFLVEETNALRLGIVANSFEYRSLTSAQRLVCINLILKCSTVDFL